MSKATKRKHVTKEVEEDLTIPQESQFIVQLVDSRGNNLHEVMDSLGERYLASMPVKFRKNIWVKRGDYVLVEPIPEGDKVKAEITKILRKDHIKFYRSQGCWPLKFDEGVQSTEREKGPHANQQNNELTLEEHIFVNTNHRIPNGVNSPDDDGSSSDTSDSD